jgi:hypothetical protein
LASSVYSPHKTKAKSKVTKKNILKKEPRSRVTAANTNLNSKRFSKSTTEVNSIDDHDRKIARIDLSSLRRIDKIPSSI